MVSNSKPRGNNIVGMWVICFLVCSLFVFLAMHSMKGDGYFLLKWGAVVSIGLSVVALALVNGVNRFFKGALARYTQSLGAKHTEGKSFLNTIASLGELQQSVFELQVNLKSNLALYKDAQVEVEVMDEIRTQLILKVARDIKAPLQAVSEETCRLLEDKESLTVAQIEDINIIYKGTVRLHKMIDEILDLSSLIVQDDLDIDDVVNLEEVIQEVFEQAKGEAANKPIDVNLEIEYHQDYILPGSRKRLWQVFSNIVSNSVKFTHRGEINIKLETLPDCLAVSIQDSGIGIPSEDIPYIFETYTQSGPSKNRNHGSGLGLAIAKRLVTLHNGDIEVFSTIGEGTTFVIKFFKKSKK